MIVLLQYLTKYLDPFNVMGVYLVQNVQLINNFTLTCTNKNAVRTVVRLCTGLCMIVLWPYLTNNLDPFNVMGVYLVQNNLLINNLTLTNLLGYITLLSNPCSGPVLPGTRLSQSVEGGHDAQKNLMVGRI